GGGEKKLEQVGEKKKINAKTMTTAKGIEMNAEKKQRKNSVPLIAMTTTRKTQTLADKQQNTTAQMSSKVRRNSLHANSTVSSTNKKKKKKVVLPSSSVKLKKEQATAKTSKTNAVSLAHGYSKPTGLGNFSANKVSSSALFAETQTKIQMSAKVNTPKPVSTKTTDTLVVNTKRKAIATVEKKQSHDLPKKRSSLPSAMVIATTTTSTLSSAVNKTSSFIQPSTNSPSLSKQTSVADAKRTRRHSAAIVRPPSSSLSRRPNVLKKNETSIITKISEVNVVKSNQVVKTPTTKPKQVEKEKVEEKEKLQKNNNGNNNNQKHIEKQIQPTHGQMDRIDDEKMSHQHLMSTESSQLRTDENSLVSSPSARKEKKDDVVLFPSITPNIFPTNKRAKLCHSTSLKSLPLTKSQNIVKQTSFGHINSKINANRVDRAEKSTCSVSPAPRRFSSSVVHDKTLSMLSTNLNKCSSSKVQPKAVVSIPVKTNEQKNVKALLPDSPRKNRSNQNVKTMEAVGKISAITQKGNLKDTTLTMPDTK
ncbi:hypothetical protein RFI_25346, partial [Reticulomyxa filosa]